MVFTIVCVPDPAMAGLNAPVEEFVIPAPLQTPLVVVVKVTGASVLQKGPA